MAEQLPHLTITGTASTEEFTSTMSGRGDFQRPPRDGRPQHAALLTSQIEQAQTDADAQTPTDEAEQRRGIMLEFQSEPEFELWLDSLENRQQGIELANVRRSGNVTCGTVFVPEGRVGFFLKRIEQYENEDTDTGAPRHQKLVESISQIRLATVEEFWTDDPTLFPQVDETIWWEVWIRTGPAADVEDAAFTEFVAEAANVGLQLGQQTIRFPERLVLLARGNQTQFAGSINLLNLLAELRRAKEVPTAYVEMGPQDQMEFIQDARERIQAPPADVPAVCLLDTGVNRSHPLLELALDESHVMAVDPELDCG